MDDAAIRARATEWWEIQFQNWGGDSAYEALADNCESDEEAEAAYDRLMELLSGTSIEIRWEAA